MTQKKDNKTIQEYPKELWDMLLLPEDDPKILAIFSINGIVDLDIIESIANGVRCVALESISKSEFYDLIKFRLNDNEDFARKLFKEFDDKILIPNNFIGLQKKAEAADPNIDTGVNNTIVEKTETAEDILKEIENPTPAPSTIPAPTPAIVAPTQTPTPTINTTPPTPEIVPIQTTTPASSSPTTTPTPPIQSSNPASMVMPTKEDILNGKLTEPSAQPLKSTYYKIDPYREQTK